VLHAAGARAQTLPLLLPLPWAQQWRLPLLLPLPWAQQWRLPLLLPVLTLVLQHHRWGPGSSFQWR